MTVTITTSSTYMENVQDILSSLGLLDVHFASERELVIHYETDSNYRDIAAWGADALSCGLIFGFQVER